MWNHIYLHVIKCSKILKFRVELLLRSLFKIFRNVKKKKVCLFFLLTVVKRPIGQSFLDNVKRSHVLPVVPGELIIFRSGVSNQFLLEWFSDDLEMNARKNGNNKQAEIERFDWFIVRIQTRVASGWLSERSSERTSCPRTFQKSTDTSLWHHTATRLANRTIPSPYYGFLWRENEEAMFWSFHSLADKQITKTYKVKPFFKVIRKSL